MKTTGEKIRERRTHLGLTQTELADKIGVTLRTITKYEKQGVMPRGRNLRELAKALGVSELYLSNDEIEDETYGCKHRRCLPVVTFLRQIRTSSSRQSWQLMSLPRKTPANDSPISAIKNKLPRCSCTDYGTAKLLSCNRKISHWLFRKR